MSTFITWTQYNEIQASGKLMEDSGLPAVIVSIGDNAVLMSLEDCAALIKGIESAASGALRAHAFTKMIDSGESTWPKIEQNLRELMIDGSCDPDDTQYVLTLLRFHYDRESFEAQATAETRLGEPQVVAGGKALRAPLGQETNPNESPE